MHRELYRGFEKGAYRSILSPAPLHTEADRSMRRNVASQPLDGGIHLAELSRARLIVNSHLMRAFSLLRRRCQALSSETSFSLVGIRRSRHCETMPPFSISTMFNQLACLGV